jgi:hypothetical protein
VNGKLQISDCRFQIGRFCARTTAVMLVLAAGMGHGLAQARGGAVPETHLTIPYLANATSPNDLDFTAALCDLTPDGQRMACRFRQVFVTQASFDQTACVITTNGYERTFAREGAARWTASDPPDGPCGIVETATLEDGGGTHWTMTLTRRATRNADTAACRAEAGDAETYSWQNVKRTLPCTTIQPGAIER